MHQTPLYHWHVARGGRIVDFAGWSMPVLYSSIIEEHQAVRTAAGLFDISHMGRLQFRGPDTVPFLDSLVTCPIAPLAPGRVRYGLVTNPDGGILDDILVYKIGDQAVDLVVNASNREKLVNWFADHRGDSSVEMTDQTFDLAMLALQGPRAADWLAPHLEFDAADLGYYRFIDSTVFNIPARISRTGYTGEDGLEFIIPANRAVEVADRLSELGEESSGTRVQPCGLGCRDTLRLEAGMPLYGHELSETVDPVSAGLDFALSKKKTFIGSEAIAAIRDGNPDRTRIGLRLEGRRIAREGTALLSGETVVGTVTSGTLSPTLAASIAMASVRTKHSNPGTELTVDLKGKSVPATVVQLPFYSRPKNNE